MKKPYLKRLMTLKPFSVWIVDGPYIRCNIDEEFTNFGQHYKFNFIPLNELWIDKERHPGEERFFIDHMITEHRLMSQGTSYNNAVEQAGKIEQQEREKNRLLANKTHEKRKKAEVIKLVHKKLLKKYSNKNLHVWIVNGEIVRDFLYIDFTEGGHDKVFPFIPNNEIWIDDDLNQKEMDFVLLHEIHERNLMKKSKGVDIKNGRVILTKDYTKIYEMAHRSASKMEFFCRHHPQQLKKLLDKEIKISLKIN